jgi:hypothetical protein
MGRIGLIRECIHKHSMKRPFKVLGLVLLGIPLLVGAALVIYAFNTGTVGCLGPCGNNGDAPFITGNITTTSESHGVLTLEFRTVGSVGTSSPSITNITIMNVDSTIGTGISNITTFQFMYNGSPVSAANPLPWDQTATGSIGVANVAAGTTYQLVSYYTLSNDGSHANFEEFSISALA